MQTPSLSPTLVLDRVTVVDVARGRLRFDQRVIIVGNRIRTVGSRHAVRLPAGAQIVVAPRRYLIPGLWDLHTHELGVRAGHKDIVLGITGIRNAHSGIPLDTLVQWRREILAGTRIGPPRQLFSGPPLNGRADSACRAMNTGAARSVCIYDTLRAQQVVDSLQAAGADMIKMYDLSAPMYFAVAAEARRRHIPFGGHLTEAPALAASDSGARILDHLWGAEWADQSGGLAALCYGSQATDASCRPAAERLRRNDSWLVPTVLVATAIQVDSGLSWRSRNRYGNLLWRLIKTPSDALWSSPLLRGGNWLRDTALRQTMPPLTAGNDSVPPWRKAGSRDTTRGSGRRTDGLLAIIERVGLPIAAGTDDVLHQGVAWALHMELAAMVAEGVSSLHALQSATLNPARLLHATDSLGTIAPGKLADLVLLDANPLADITNTTTIRAVVANGRYFDRVALDRLLDEMDKPESRQP